DDLDVALEAVLVGMAHRVRAGLGQRELQVVERLVRDRAHAGDGRQSEPPERDVLGLRRNRQPHRAAYLVHQAASTPARLGLTRKECECLRRRTTVWMLEALAPEGLTGPSPTWCVGRPRRVGASR